MNLTVGLKMRIRSLRRRHEICSNVCASLAAEFEIAAANDEKAAIARRWQEAVKQSHSLQYQLEQLEKQEREKRAG